MKPEIAFIGGGNMAASMIGGMIAAGTTPASILVAEPDAGARARLETATGVLTTDLNGDALEAAVVVLAVKPQVMQRVCRELAADAGAARPLYISIAAGIRCADIERWLSGGAAVALVRCMPNTPALLQCGATALFANAHASENDRQCAENILAASGITCWVDEEFRLDAVTALSGSGPAYFFLLMEAMQAAAEKLGLDAATAAALCRQTALGAARMATEGDAPPRVLRERVTSKGGTTAAAIASFEAAGFGPMVENALRAACERAEELAVELGRDEPHQP